MGLAGGNDAGDVPVPKVELVTDWIGESLLKGAQLVRAERWTLIQHNYLAVS